MRWVFLCINIPSENSQFIHKYHFFVVFLFIALGTNPSVFLCQKLIDSSFFDRFEWWGEDQHISNVLSPVRSRNSSFLYLNRTTTMPTYPNPLTFISVPLQHNTSHITQIITIKAFTHVSCLYAWYEFNIISPNTHVTIQIQIQIVCGSVAIFRINLCIYVHFM